jgi:hypothetical protein
MHGQGPEIHRLHTAAVFKHVAEEPIGKTSTGKMRSPSTTVPAHSMPDIELIGTMPLMFRSKLTMKTLGEKVVLALRLKFGASQPNLVRRCFPALLCYMLWPGDCQMLILSQYPGQYLRSSCLPYLFQ